MNTKIPVLTLKSESDVSSYTTFCVFPVISIVLKFTPFVPPTVKRRPTSAKANLTWWRYHRLMEDFCSGESCESLIIPQDGKYRLSLQIIYSGGIPKNPPDLQIKLAHKIVMYHDMERPVTLRTVYETETVHENSPWFKSVSSEVIYVFRKGDKIMVESENADLIYTPDVDWWTINLLTIQLISEIN